MDDALTTQLLRGLRVAQSIIVITIMFGLNLPAVLATVHDYGSPVAAFGWFGAFLVAAFADAFLVVGRRSWGSARWPAAVAVLAASWGASLALPAHDLIGIAHWTLGTTGWFGALLFSDKPIRYALIYVALHDVASVAQLALAGRWDGASLVGLFTILVGVSSFQVAAAAAAAALRTVARAATAAARAQAEATTRHAAAEQVHLDRQMRYAELRRDVVPLLEGISSGTEPPTDIRVQRRAALEAARMRRLFTEHTDAVEPLAVELGALCDMVERRGVTVTFVASSVPNGLPDDVRRTLLEAVSETLLNAECSARVTIGSAADDVLVSVVADGGAGPAGLRIRPNGVRTNTVADESRTWVEARWASAGVPRS